MSRYVKKFKSTTALGPTEERGFALWAGYEIDGVDDDLSNAGLIRVDDWSEEKLRELGVTAFTRVARGDVAMYEKLGIDGLIVQ
jgi:hypothetical protein